MSRMRTSNNITASNISVNKYPGKQIRFALANRGSDRASAKSLTDLDDLVYVVVYEGYRKLGMFKLSDARIKFK